MLPAPASRALGLISSLPLVSRTLGSQPAKCQDAPYGFCFIAHVIAMIVVAAWKGSAAISEFAIVDSGSATTDDPVQPQPKQQDQMFTPGEAVATLASSAAIGAVISALWVVFLVRHARSLIICTIWSAIVVNVLAAVAFFFLTGSPFAALPFGILALISVCFWCAMRRHIPFASANLAIAAKAISTARLTVCYAYLTLLIQLVWTVVWALAAIGTVVALIGDDLKRADSGASGGATWTGDVDLSTIFSPRGGPAMLADDNANGAHDDDGLPASDPAMDNKYRALYGVSVLLVLSFYWGTQVVRNTLHVVTAGTVGTWWADAHAGDPTCGSVRRACTTSFGSIALGSLLIAIVQTLRWMAESAQRNAARNGNVAARCCMCFAACIVRMLEDVLKYFTAYAFCEVALYGTSFWESGRKAFTLFGRRGWNAVFNDTIIDRALVLGSFVFGAIASLSSALIGRLFIARGGPDQVATVTLICAVVGFVVGVLMCMIISGIIESAVKTVFVCFAEAPEKLLAAHPREFSELTAAWYHERRDLVEAAGYDRLYSIGASDYA